MRTWSAAGRKRATPSRSSCVRSSWFRKRLVAHDAVPTIVELQQRLEEIRSAELEKCLRSVGPVTPAQHEAIVKFSTQLVNKILHYPILQLKEASEEPQERESLRRTIRKIFGLR
jgi:glutamyl-tRNA reductase